MHVDVTTSDGTVGFEASTLEVARMVASVFGFEVDLEPQMAGKSTVKLTASHRTKATLVFNGKNINEAAGGLIKALTR